MNTTLRSTPNIKIDRELQEKMYTNIALLNMVHPPSQEFKSIFKKDMFAQTNKVAFFHVIHYLLTVLNPEVAKAKLTTWPTYNVIKLENKFRSEVLQCLNELNSLYKDAELPTIMSSHLVAPGGYRFINFMYRLSQLVLYEDLKKTYPNIILQRPKKGKIDILKVCDDFEKVIKQISTRTNCAINKFEKKLGYFKKESEKIVSEKFAVNEDLKKIEKEIDVEKHKLKGYEVFDEGITAKIESARNKSNVINKIIDTYTECKTFLGYLAENNADQEMLDLSDAVQRLSISLKRQLSELTVYTAPELEFYLKEVEETKMEFEILHSRFTNQQESLLESMKSSEHMLKNIIADLYGQ